MAGVMPKMANLRGLPVILIRFHFGQENLLSLPARCPKGRLAYMAVRL